MAGEPDPRPLRVLACGSPGSGLSTLVELLAGTPVGHQDPPLRWFDIPMPSGPCLLTEMPADAPHTRHWVAAASEADVALIVVDAAQGVSAHTRRQACLLGLLGVRRWALVVNKIDSVGFDAATVARIDTELRAFAAPLGALSITTLPVSGLQGDNLSQRSTRTPWYAGPPLRAWLEDGFAARLQPQPQLQPLLPPGAAAEPQPATADQFECTLLWLDDAPLLPGRRYTLVLGDQRVDASVTDIKHRLDVHTLQAMAARTLARDEVGVCKLALDAPVSFEAYAVNRARGRFLLVDRSSAHPGVNPNPQQPAAAAGLLHFALRRAQNLTLQPLLVDKAARVALMGQQPLVLWFTGLSGAGKSSIANEVAVRLHALGCHTAQLDGDNLRHGLNRDLGFTAADRVENIRRVAEVARLMVDAGLIVLASFISPFRSERELARSRVAPGEFIEVYVDVPLAVAETRDTKGLYARARRGELPHFTGIGSPYEAPEAPEVHLRTDQLTLAEAAEAVMQALRERGLLR